LPNFPQNFYSGIGRTGTIIALEVGIRKLMAANELSIWNVVRTLREQRYNACQTPGQYVYIQ
jgi:protein tyrosine phosphatase